MVFSRSRFDIPLQDNTFHQHSVHREQHGCRVGHRRRDAGHSTQALVRVVDSYFVFFNTTRRSGVCVFFADDFWCTCLLTMVLVCTYAPWSFVAVSGVHSGRGRRERSGGTPRCRKRWRRQAGEQLLQYFGMDAGACMVFVPDSTAVTGKRACLNVLGSQIIQNRPTILTTWN